MAANEDEKVEFTLKIEGGTEEENSAALLELARDLKEALGDNIDIKLIPKHPS